MERAAQVLDVAAQGSWFWKVVHGGTSPTFARPTQATLIKISIYLWDQNSAGESVLKAAI